MKIWEEHVGDVALRIDEIDGNVVANATKVHDTVGQARAWLEQIRFVGVAVTPQDENRTTYGLKGYRSGD